MSANERNGRRKPRGYQSRRVPDLGYYYIVTDTKETEKNYLEGIRNKLPEKLKDRLVIKVIKAETDNLVKTCLEGISADPQYREPWIVLDRDEVQGFDRIIEDAKNKGISTGWSNPCIEIWFAAYFGEMHFCETSVTCCDYFSTLFKRKTGLEYDKADKKNYEHLMKHGDELKAIKFADQRFRNYLNSNNKVKPSQMYSCTTLHELVREINSKVTSTDNMKKPD